MNFQVNENKAIYAAFNADHAELYLGTWGWFGNSVEELESKKNYGMLCNIKGKNFSKRFCMYEIPYSLFQGDPTTKKLMTYEQLAQWVGRFGLVRKSNMIHNYFSYHDGAEGKKQVHPIYKIKSYGSDEWVPPTEDIFIRDCLGITGK